MKEQSKKRSLAQTPDQGFMLTKGIRSTEKEN